MRSLLSFYLFCGFPVAHYRCLQWFHYRCRVGATEVPYRHLEVPAGFPAVTVHCLPSEFHENLLDVLNTILVSLLSRLRGMMVRGQLGPRSDGSIHSVFKCKNKDWDSGLRLFSTEVNKMRGMKTTARTQNRLSHNARAAEARGFGLGHSGRLAGSTVFTQRG